MRRRKVIQSLCFATTFVCYFLCNKLADCCCLHYNPETCCLSIGILGLIFCIKQQPLGFLPEIKLLMRRKKKNLGSEFLELFLLWGRKRNCVEQITIHLTDIQDCKRILMNCSKLSIKAHSVKHRLNGSQ